MPKMQSMADMLAQVFSHLPRALMSDRQRA
jgi:hypothetical protein